MVTQHEHMPIQGPVFSKHDDLSLEKTTTKAEPTIGSKQHVNWNKCKEWRNLVSNDLQRWPRYPKY
jgi:hypothetical protein